VSRYTRTNNFPAGQKARGSEVKAELDAIQQWSADMPDSDAVWSGAVNFAQAGGTANALTVTLDNTWTTYTGKDGYQLCIRVTANSTGAVTLAVDGLATRPVVRRDGTALTSGDLKLQGVYSFVYNEVNERFHVDAFNEANIKVVVDNIANVNLVAGSIANVNTVSGAIANVNTVAGAIANVNAVGASIANVNTVAGIGTEVVAVAGNAANVNTVGTNIANVNATGASIASVNTVSAAIANVNTTATNIANVNLVGGSIANVNATGGSIASVNTVANAGNLAAVNTTATNIANVNTVAGISGNVTTVAGVSANVTTVAGVSANVTTVAGIAANVTTVAGISANVTAVATNATNVNTVATNIANVNSAVSSATIATTKASEASASAASALASKNAAEAAEAAAVAIVYGGEFSTEAAAGKVPIADVDGNIGNDWLDVGSAPQEIPTNAHLGGMAYQSPESVVIKPQAVAVPNGIGDMTFQATSDSVIEMEYKGSDAVVRTAQIPLSNERLVEMSRVTSLTQAVRVAMTAAASGSNGIRVLDNADIRFGTGNFAIHWEGSLPDYTPASNLSLYVKSSGVTNVVFGIYTAGTMRMFLNQVDYASTVATGLTDGSNAKLSVVVTRESASVAGSVAFYVNGVQLGSSVSIPAGSPGTTDFAVSAYISGNSSVRIASDTQQAIIYNRALSAAEVLSLCVNGPALADIGASQVNLFTGQTPSITDSGGSAGSYDVGTRTMSNTGTGADNSYPRFTFALGMVVGVRYRVSGLLTGVNLTVINAIRTGASGFASQVAYNSTTGVFSAEITAETANLYFLTNSTLGTWSITIDNMTVARIGITGQWNAQDAQSNTGQIFDSSGNKNHALLPAAGATIIGKESAQVRQVRWTNTWAGTNELQYIGGVNQAILPANAYIESIVGTVTGATPHDIIIGNGSDTDRYVTITTGLAAGTTSFTLANRTTDGTNLKLTVDPDTNATMSIAWVITYSLLEA
jgi:hypothetical protein